MDVLKPREEMFGRIRAALRDRGSRPPAALSPPAPAEGAAGKTALDLFRERFEAVGGLFLPGGAIDRALPVLGEKLRMEDVTRLLCPGDDADARTIAEALAPFGPFAIAAPGEAGAGESPPGTAGIQSAEFAVAETGTIVQTSRGGRTLLPGVLADVHVALLRREMVVPRMEDCLLALADDLPRNVSFITGPSRTADIEQTMVAGAHGPRRVIALLL